MLLSTEWRIARQAESSKASRILLTAAASRWSKSTKVSAGQSRARNSSRVTHFTRGFQKRREHTERLFLEPNFHSALAQFTSTLVDHEASKANKVLPR
jgi:hypothetical protein